MLVEQNSYKLGYHHLNLIQIKTAKEVITNYYGENNHFFGSCDNSKNCFFKLSQSEVELNGEIQKIIEVSGVPVGILYKGNFYPVIIDHRIAVIGLLNAEGSAIKFLRHQDAWGNVEKVTGDRTFEKLIAFEYARLMQNPLVEQLTKTKLYFSGTRVYSPEMVEWLSPDSTVVWNPEKLVNNPGNWDPFKYANNDPLNFLDESGRFVQLIPAAVGGIVGAGVGYINAVSTKGNVGHEVLAGAITGAAMGSGGGAIMKIATSVAAKSSLVSILGFTTSVLTQGIVNRKIDIVDASVLAVLGPLGMAYGNLFNKLPKMLAESVSGMSFASVDLLIGFSVKKNMSLKLNDYNKKASDSFRFENYQLKTSFGD